MFRSVILAVLVCFTNSMASDKDCSSFGPDVKSYSNKISIKNLQCKWFHLEEAATNCAFPKYKGFSENSKDLAKIFGKDLTYTPKKPFCAKFIKATNYFKVEIYTNPFKP